MSLRQDELIRRLPENGFNIAKTAREVGYTAQGSRSGTLYASLRAKIEKAFNPDTVKADICKAEKDFKKAKDNSNRARMIELKAKIAGLTKEQGNTQVTALFSGHGEKLKAVILESEPVNNSVDNSAQGNIAQEQGNNSVDKPVDNSNIEYSIELEQGNKQV